MSSTIPYLPISHYYKKIFGEKVYKIPVTVVQSCPNRQGLRGMETCIFCDPWGSAAKAEFLNTPLRLQIESLVDHIGPKYKAQSFLVYFQAYTNTFTKVQQMRQAFDTALSYPFVKGLVVGTRPDCLSPAVLELWKEYSRKTHISVELGVQSFNDSTLRFLKRGHTRQQNIDAIEKIKTHTDVHLGLHFIFGNPKETTEDIVECAELSHSLGVHSVKLHNLHVLKQTPLETLYHQGLFQPVDFSTYSERVSLFLQHLSPDIYIHRLAALSTRPEELVAPQWVAFKMATHQKLIDDLIARHITQGCLFQKRDPS
jgi:uncharacterized protein